MGWCSFGVSSYLLIFLISLSYQKSIAPDNEKLYHDIVSGRGLYNNFKQILELTTLNFNDTIFNSKVPKTWVVEFYNSWCGHCHRFAPIYKSLALDIYNWREVVAVGAVDCANDANNQLCRDYEIMGYPSLKLFPIGSHYSFLGDSFMKGTVDQMRLDIVKEVENEDASEKTRENLILKPFTESDINVLWFNVPVYVQYIVVVIVDPEATPHLSTEVALDLYPVKNVQVRKVQKDNKGLLLSLPVELTPSLPSVYVIARDNTPHSIHLSGRARDDIVNALGVFFKDVGIHIPKKEKKDISDLEFDVNHVMQVMHIQEEVKKKLNSKDLSDIVFQVDIEGALRYSLYHEIGNKKVIEGDKLIALRDYMTVLNKYYPIGLSGRKFLQNLTNYVLLKDSVHGHNFTTFAKGVENNLSGVFLPQQNWIGCQGSQPSYRGYPCSLWTMFHTLTVQASQKEESYPGSNTQEVLKAMAGYIKNFFGCTDCSEHFQQMAGTIAGNVTSLDDSILWLWRAHNSANRRLAGDVTEDPEHKKIQFPSSQSCPKCRTTYGDWNTHEVLDFLKSMYTNISYIQWSDLPQQPVTTKASPISSAYSKRLRHDNFADDSGFKEDGTGRSLWGFNLFDISLCVTLYTTSVVILLLVFIKFVMRKSNKKKPFVIEAHNKV